MTKYIELEDVEILRETGKALMVEVEGEEIWLPISQVKPDPEHEVGYVGEISITEWIAEQKGII